MSQTVVVSIIIHNTSQARNAIYRELTGTIIEEFKELNAIKKLEVEFFYRAGAFENFKNI